MSSNEDSSSSESDNDNFPDINKLKPYDLEPEIASSELSSTSSGDDISSSSDSEKDDDSRIGNTSWCLCGGKCLRTRKAFAVVIQTKYVTIILKVNHKHK